MRYAIYALLPQSVLRADDAVYTEFDDNTHYIMCARFADNTL